MASSTSNTATTATTLPPPEEEIPEPTPLMKDPPPSESHDPSTTPTPSDSNPAERPNKTTTTTPRNLATALTQARRDLWSAQPIRPLRFLLNPLRSFVWDPSLAIFSILLPPLIPRSVDGCLTFLCVHVTLPILHGLYPKLDLHDVEHDDMQSTAKNTLLHTTPTNVVIALTPPTDLQSAVQGSVGFVVSAIGDVLGALTNPAKLQGWTKAMAQFNGFLEASGVADELQESLLKPLWRGRLLDNLKILNDIQEETTNLNMKERARKCVISGGDGGYGDCENYEDVADPSPSSSSIKSLSQEVLDGKRLMRFATAAYGTEMIRSALDKNVSIDQLETLQTAISVHTDIREEDVKLVFADQSGANTADKHVLHHFVAVDRCSKSIVLALRGTLSLSGAIVDMQGMAVDFCSGKAHKGIAEMAENVWAQSGDFILNLLLNEEEYADYRLLITGHSLGAGTACLLNVKLHHEQILSKQNRQVVCYAFAPPPTFEYCPGSSALTNRDGDDKVQDDEHFQRAIQNTVAYIHDNDVVPFLSIAVVRRLALLLDTVDNQTEFLWFWKRWRIFYEYDTVPKEIADRVVEASTTKQRAVDGASELKIPARMVVWCKKKEEGCSSTPPPTAGNSKAGTFEAFGCDPNKVAEQHIFLCQDMLTDHLPEQYENALDALAEDVSTA